MLRLPIRRTPLRTLAAAVAIALLPVGITFATATAAPAATAARAATAAPAAEQASPPRPQGPCDIYAAGGTPCVAAHSTTRALYASYNGPLYQVRRLSDNAVKNIGVVRPRALPLPDPGGYADAAAQDAFCANTTCVITKIYDQSPNHNDLTQAPRGAFSGPAMGGFDNLPIADMAPITISGHQAYGVFIAPGMGLRDNHPTGTAVGDQPEGMYWVLDGQHFNDGCCFDYGNAEIDSRDDGNGTMETSYFGNATAWYHGNPPGPWIMTDQENNLVGCVNPGSTSKLCADLPNITSRFVTAVAKGEPHHWASLGGDAQTGDLSTMFDGPRVDSSYDPMRKQGAIVLGNGGDNSNGCAGHLLRGRDDDRIPDRRHRPEGSGQHRGRPVRRAAAEPDAGLGDCHPARAPDVRTAVLARVHRDVHEHHGVARGGREAEHLGAQQAVDLRRPGQHRHVARRSIRSRPARA